jgi:glycosyltransferase involved in cell wall biosynthesis
MKPDKPVVSIVDAGDQPLVSVIIPVFNDSQRLRKCLERLENQTYPKDRYEAIVVDNGSTEPVEPIVAAFGQAKLVREERAGAFVARNTAIAHSNGEVLAFTDSDCLPASDWIEKGVKKLLETPNCGQVGGRLHVFARHPNRPTSAEVWECVRAFPQQHYIEREHYAATGNMFTLRKAYDIVGPFDESMKSGGDNEWGKRLRASGFAQAYAYDALVLHPARHSFGQIYEKIIRTAGGHRHIWDLQGKTYSFLQFVVDLRPPIKAIWAAMFDPRLRGPKQKLQFATVEVFVRWARAWAKYRLHLRSAGQPQG